MMNLTVEKVEGKFFINGEGIEAVINYYEGNRSSVKGKGARKHKTEIIEAVAEFLKAEAKKAYDAKEEERKQQRESFLQSNTYSNIDLLSLYKVDVFYYDEYHSNWFQFTKLLTGCEVLNDSRIVKAELYKINNTDIFSIGGYGDGDRQALTDNRIFIIGRYPYVTGLTLKEMLLDGFKTYDRVRLIEDIELRSIQQYGQQDRTARQLFDTTSMNDQMGMKQRYNMEIKRAEETTEEPSQKELYTNDSKAINYAWFSSKPCSIKEVLKFEFATFDRYVIGETITLEKESFELFCDTLDMGMLETEFKGGTNSTYELTREVENIWELTEEERGKWSKESYREVLEVVNAETGDTLLIDPQGYNYARYIAVKEGFEPTPDNNNDTKINNNESNSIEVVEEVTEVVSEPLTVEIQHNSEQVKTLATYETGTGVKGNGIEINFTEKPSAETRQIMKANGYKWGGKKRPSIWWAINTPEAEEVAKDICGVVEGESYNNSDNEELPKVKQMQTEQHENDNIVNFDNVIPFINNSSEAQTLEMNLQTFSDAPTLDDILGAFDEVDMKEESGLISEEDREYCEAIEKEYKNIISVFESNIKMYENMIESQEFEFLSKFSDIYHIQDRMKQVKSSFIHKVLRYFKDKYTIQIDSYKIVDKYDHNVTLDDLINELLEVTNGLTFTELSEQQTKKDMREAASSQAKVNNNKVSLPSFVYMDSIDEKYGTLRVSYNCRDKIDKLINALKLHNRNDGDLLEEFGNTLNYAKNDELVTIHELELTKIKSIKVFKNGRLDITFNTNEQAKRFYNEYIQ